MVVGRRRRRAREACSPTAGVGHVDHEAQIAQAVTTPPEVAALFTALTTQVPPTPTDCGRLSRNEARVPETPPPPPISRSLFWHAAVALACAPVVLPSVAVPVRTCSVEKVPVGPVGPVAPS